MRAAELKPLIVAVVTAAVALGSIAGARADHFDDLAGSAMSGGRPTPEAAKSLKDELLFQRATQVYLWAMPLINTLVDCPQRKIPL